MKKFVNFFTFIYPFIIFITKDLPLYSISLILIFLALANIYLIIKNNISKKELMIPSLFIIVGICSLAMQSSFYLRIVPMILSFYFFLIFFKSNFNEKTLIEYFASLKKQEGFSTQEIIYLKKLNWIWTYFLLLNLILQIIVLFMPLYIWTIYTNVVFYILIGSLFSIEFLYRKLVFEKRLNL